MPEHPGMFLVAVPLFRLYSRHNPLSRSRSWLSLPCWSRLKDKERGRDAVRSTKTDIMWRHNVLEESIRAGNEDIGEREERNPAILGPLKMYLSEISKYPLLSKEEELEVGEKARRYKDIDAFGRLVSSNLRLVVKIALEYYGTYSNILDLIQEGNEGLVRAARKYDPYRGARFSTYSSFWIRAYMLKHIMDSRSIVKMGTTQGQRRLFFGLKKEKRRLEAAGVFPAAHLVASVLGVKTGEVEDMEKRLSCPDISLDRPVNEEGGETFIDMIGTGDNVEETVADRETKEILERKIAEFRENLGEKDLFIFNERIMTEEPLTLHDIGERLGVSRERVRQLERRVLNRFTERFQREFKGLDL